MKKRYLVIIFLLLLFTSCKVNALVKDDCEVLVSFKLNSSLDEDSYICKGKKFGKEGDKIYYSGDSNVIELNNASFYYLSNYDNDITLNVTNKNNISLLHVSDKKIKVTGKGYLKFKQNSYVNKQSKGEVIYNFSYKNKLILTEDKKAFEGTKSEFKENYDILKKLNNLPNEYNEDDLKYIAVSDYINMTSVAITSSWLNKHLDTSLKSYVSDGYGIVEYVKEDSSTLESTNIILVSNGLKTEYKLIEENLKDDEVAKKVSSILESKNLISLYDISVYEDNSEVEMKNGNYTIKIKLEDADNYENYQIIYVNDDGEIEEYLDGRVENGYIVFETTHLSQYGIIGTNLDTGEVLGVTKKNIDYSLIFKISILVIFITLSISFLTFLVLKSQLLTKKKRKRRA